MHHTIPKKIKEGLGEFGCARGPQVRVDFFFLAMLRALCILLPWTVPVLSDGPE